MSGEGAQGRAVEGLKGEEVGRKEVETVEAEVGREVKMRLNSCVTVCPCADRSSRG